MKGPRQLSKLLVHRVCICAEDMGMQHAPTSARHTALLPEYRRATPKSRKRLVMSDKIIHSLHQLTY